MPLKIIHNICQCGNKKQVRSNICRECYQKIKGICNCGSKLSRKSKNQCLNCYKQSRLDYMINNTDPIKNYRYKTSDNPNHWVKIRSHANRIAEYHNMKRGGCCICNFPHVDVCHIKPIKDFHENTSISEVNNPSNLIILCKNCHWLFDHGYNSVESIKNYYDSIKPT